MRKCFGLFFQNKDVVFPDLFLQIPNDTNSWLVKTVYAQFSIGSYVSMEVSGHFHLHSI